MPESYLEKYSLGDNSAMLKVRSWRPDQTVPEHAEYLADTRPILVLLHYFGGSSREWRWIAPILAGPCYACIAFDARGHGASMADDTFGSINHSVEAMAEDARMVAFSSWCDSRVGGWVLVGHSMGGKVALQLAASKPDGLRGLILVAPSPPTPQPMSDEERRDEIDSYGDAAASEKNATKIAVAPLSEEARAVFVEDNLRTAKSAWNAWNEHGTREDISAVMSNIDVPTLLITGSDDPVIPQNVYQREVSSRLPQAPEQMEIEGGGHLLPMTHADLIAGKIGDWIRSLSG